MTKDARKDAERKRPLLYWWKCQQCGLTYDRVTSGEPRVGCPCCGDKGVKTFEGRGRYGEKIVRDTMTNEQTRKDAERLSKTIHKIMDDHGVHMHMPGNIKLRDALVDALERDREGRCHVTGNPVGTDTHMVGGGCQCSACVEHRSPTDKIEAGLNVLVDKIESGSIYWVKNVDTGIKMIFVSDSKLDEEGDGRILSGERTLGEAVKKAVEELNNVTR
jgi:predicted  nucleic acid-binding Zn-ribbon protein